MKLIRSELLKLRTTRTAYFLLAGLIGLSVITVLDAGFVDTIEKPFDEQAFVFFTAMLARVLIVIFGIRLVTDEFRHGTIVPTLLGSPHRSRVLAAKAIVAGVAGLVGAAIAWTVMTVGATFIASAEGATLALDSNAWMTLIGMAGAGALWGIIGVFVGAIVRHQLAATIGALLWLMAIEDTLRGLFGDIGDYLPGSMGMALVLTPVGVGIAAVLATLAGYLATFGFAATRSMRRDIA